MIHRRRRIRLVVRTNEQQNSRLQFLVRAGLMGGAGATVAAILIQGPYSARGFDEQRFRHSAATRNPGDPVRPRADLAARALRSRRSTVGILLVTALLSTTAPPAHAAESNTHTDHAAQLANGTVMMSLGDRGKAVLRVLPATTAGSWKAILTVDGISESAVVTSADIRVATGP